MKKKMWIRVVALVLVIMLCATAFSAIAFASEEVEAETITQMATDGGVEAEPAADTQAEAEQASATLNYVVIDDVDAQSGQVQRIALSLGDEGSVISDAVLSIRNKDTGTLVSVEASAYESNASAFSFDYSIMSTGIYVLDSVSFKLDGVDSIYNFADKEYVFGVNKDVETNPDAYITEDDGTNDVVTEDISVIVTDENGNVTSGDFDVLNPKKRSANGKMVVVLDPGHDASHGGTNGHGQKEGDLNLKIALAARAELSKNPNIEVYMTRDTMACPNGGGNNGACLERRAQIAAERRADLFVSFHLNATVGGSGGSARGAEVYYPNTNYNPLLSTQGQSAATKILDQLGALGIAKRGVKIRNASTDRYPDGSMQDYYAVIRHSKLRGIAGIIIEHAFLDNSGDYNNFLNSDEKLYALGAADARGIAQYLGSAEANPYDAVFSATYYYNNNKDLQAAFERPTSDYDANASKLLNHFITYGMKEKRVASSEFNINYYANRYADLRNAFGNDWPRYYDHYMKNGKAEGRDAKTPAQKVPTTTLGGVNYSAVYSFNEYQAKYPDIKAAFGDNDEATLAHFVNYGMNERRMGKSSFDVMSYYNQYRDLRAAFGTNWRNYYMHYISNGAREGRKATGVTSLQNPTTVLNGIDYSAVYNYNYYTTLYPDIKKAFPNDEIGTLSHFVTWGMREKRQGSSEFNVDSYYKKYPDLRAVFGTNWAGYYNHYMRYGKGEGRTAIAGGEYVPSTGEYMIMGVTACSAAKMASVFSTRNSGFNTGLYGMSLVDFCQTYIDIAQSEGVRGEVAFAQMCLETGWLKFGGDVSPGQYNFAGIGATGGGAPGNSFNDAGSPVANTRKGILAQVQHLRLYAKDASTNNPNVDPRHFASIAGTAPTVQSLEGKWATGANYGQKIMNIINMLLG